MKPLRLEMQAFGPFPNKEVVDFTDLSKNGLFLICGETGSGKTTILDAITFSLYGKGTSDLRNKVEDMRCNNAKWGDDTIIRYDMECKGNIYRFEIVLECGRINLKKKLQVYRKKSGVFEPQFENCKDKDVYGDKRTKGYTENLIGLSYEQFKQIVILPQGQFEKFLVSKSDEKEAILSEIFNVKKWAEISEIMFNNAKAKNDDLAGKKQDLNSKLSVENVDSLDTLKNNICKEQEELEKIEKDYKSKNVESLKENIEKDKNVVKLYYDYDILLANRKKLMDRKEIAKQYEFKRDMALKANLYKKDLDSLDRLYTDRKKRNDQLEKLKKEEKLTENNFNKVLLNYTQLKEQEKIYQDKSNLIVEYKSKIGKYRSIEDAKTTFNEATKLLKKKKDEQIALNKEQEKAKQEHKSLVEKWKALDTLHKEMYDAYNNGLYGEIASHLEEGKPCPVCGSIHHPQLASKVDGTPSKQAVDKKYKEVQLAYKTANDFEKTIPDLTQINDEVNEIQRKYEVAKQNYESINNDLIEGISTLQELNLKVKSLEDEVAAYNKDLENLEKKKNSTEKQVTANKTNVENAQKEIDKVNKELNAVQTSIQEKIKNSNEFATIEEIKKYMLSEEELNDCSARLTKYNTLVEDNERLIQDKEKELVGIKQVKKEDIDQKEKELNAFILGYTSQKATLSKEIERKQKLYNSLKETQTYIDENGAQIESDFKLAKSIRGDSGIGLQRYVLGVMFNTVINAANQMLSKVHGGRYKLYRSDEKGKGNKKGLELYVYDNYCLDEENRSRSVGYLSGGEKFLVSLSLSIGLSSVAQSSGIKLEAMFIDEGFGTLSTKSIDDAMDILMDIKKSSSVVGIISHVQLLRDNIPTKLEIVKQKEGSYIKKSIG